MQSPNRKKNLRLSKEERSEILAAYRESGMTQKSFAESWGLNTGTFRSWLYASGEPVGQGEGFIEVAVSGQVVEIATLRFPGGTTLEFPLEALERSALALARELGEPC